MTSLIILSIIAYGIYKTLCYLSNDINNTNGISDMNEEEELVINATKAKVREIASRYNASQISCGSTFIGDDGYLYLNCSVDVDESDALDLADDMDDEFGDNIDNMDITFNNNTMDNNQQQPPQIIVVNNNHGTINGDYHNHHDGPKSNKPSDDAEDADFEEIKADEPLPVKSEVKDEACVKAKPAVKDICAKLKTKKAMTVWKRLQDKGWVDDNCHPVELLGWQEVLLANAIAKHVGIRNKWQVFEQFWDMTFMKQTFQKAVSNPDAAGFYRELKDLGL